MPRKGRRQLLKGGDEYDVVTGWRRLLIWKKGQIRKAKRSMNKRERKESKEKLHDRRED